MPKHVQGLLKVYEHMVEVLLVLEIFLREGFLGQCCGLYYPLQDSTEGSSTDKVGTSLERQEHFSQFQDTTDALPCHIHRPVYL